MKRWLKKQNRIREKNSVVKYREYKIDVLIKLLFTVNQNIAPPDSIVKVNMPSKVRRINEACPSEMLLYLCHLIPVDTALGKKIV